jgi:hypothetical protein
MKLMLQILHLMPQGANIKNNDIHLFLIRCTKINATFWVYNLTAHSYGDNGDLYTPNDVIIFLHKLDCHFQLYTL